MSEDMYNHLHALEAALQAWTNPGPVQGYHEAIKHHVREVMPLLARALDRAARERKQ